MSSSYYPYQPPLYMTLLSVQQISTRTTCDLPSAPRDEPSTSCSSHQVSSGEDPVAEAVREKQIQSSFETNLSEHKHAYLDQYVGKTVTSFGSDVGPKSYPSIIDKLNVIVMNEKRRLERAAKEKTYELRKSSKKKVVAKKKALSNKWKKASGSDGVCQE
jgi:hypothetical protein